MNNDTLSLHEHISLEAFLLSEQAGHPAGMDETFWTQAEAIVHGRTAVVAGAGKATAKAKAKTPTKPKASRLAVARNGSPSAKKQEAPAKTKSAGKRAK